MALKIGLTGGIGSGKTTVAKIFALLGVPVYYADEASKNLYHSHEGLIASLKKQFGEDIYINGNLDRAKLAGLVFSDPLKLEILNSLVHPLTISDATSWMEQQNAPYLIKEAAILFESGSVKGLDYVIGVRAAEHVRISRVMHRDNLGREEVISRMQRQMDEDIKMRLCDFIIENNEQQLVIPQVLTLHNQFLSMATTSSS
jgi:dephospho-CoA kinase